MNKSTRDEATHRVREFYDGPADTIYKTTWGENLHLAVPRGDGESGRDAAEHTTELMAAQSGLNADARVLDLGCGYGGPARFLASRFGCRVSGLNLSRVEIEEAQRLTRETQHAKLVNFDEGDFHELPYPDASFEVVWSQDSLMYGASKSTILAETLRVLKPGGRMVFTDILASRDLDPDVRTKLYARVRTPEMWDTERYLNELIDLGFKIRRVEDWSQHVAASYAWARKQTSEKREALEAGVGPDLVQATLDGLAFWVGMAEQGHVGWSFIVAQKIGPR